MEDALGTVSAIIYRVSPKSLSYTDWPRCCDVRIGEKRIDLAEAEGRDPGLDPLRFVIG